LHSFPGLQLDSLRAGPVHRRLCLGGSGRTHPPKMVLISKAARRTVANANRLRIRIPRHGIKTTILLHEIAHSMTGSIDKPGDHGPAFIGTFMRLVCHHIRTFSLPQLMDSARSEGVDFDLTMASSGGPVEGH